MALTRLQLQPKIKKEKPMKDFEREAGTMDTSFLATLAAQFDTAVDEYYGSLASPTQQGFRLRYLSSGPCLLQLG
ncbi:MAG: hypothetical protein ABI833_21385 [Acidobacteriota bacterium]